MAIRKRLPEELDKEWLNEVAHRLSMIFQFTGQRWADDRQRLGRPDKRQIINMIEMLYADYRNDTKCFAASSGGIRISSDEDTPIVTYSQSISFEYNGMPVD